MEALTISAANLNTIEKNLGAVANELSGVINNVSSVNNQVNKVEEKVATLNDEVKNLIKEIRETTIITNARQSIMYNNTQIEKKYGYYDHVRRTTESLISAIEASNISTTSLLDLKQELILNNPNYWLANALASLTSWLLDDHENTEKELNNALKKDSKKTSLFFCLINLKLGRVNTSINWLNKYLSEQNPLKLDKDFVTILDLVTNGFFGNEAKQIVFNKINNWFIRLNSESSIKEKQLSTWLDYINKEEETEITMPYLDIHSKDKEILKNNLAITSSYANVLKNLETILYNDQENKALEEILSNLIYEYESNEQIFQKDNLKNNLIIACNGNREEAEKLYQKQESIYNNEIDLPSLLTNIVIYKDSYKISNETQKLALSLIKEYIIKAYELKNNKLNTNPFNISIDNFETKTKDGKNRDEINKELKEYISTQFNNDDKDLIVILLIVNILGIIGIFITLNNKTLNIILISILAIGNLFLMYQLHKRNNLRTKEKIKLQNNISSKLDRILAEALDYTNIINTDKEKYIELINFLNTINQNNFLKTNNERNISIGE